MSAVGSRGWNLVQGTIAQVFPSVLASPYLVFGGTDARHFHDICDSVYRFAPTLMAKSDLRLIHGTNERIEEASIGGMINFYIQLIKNSQGDDRDGVPEGVHPV